MPMTLICGRPACFRLPTNAVLTRPRVIGNIGDRAGAAQARPNDMRSFGSEREYGRLEGIDTPMVSWHDHGSPRSLSTPANPNTRREWITHGGANHA
jgi:hypothetical protein